jgi:hypothetical protein
MSALSIQVPFPVFQDRDGQPLENGYIWIGEANLNPQTNPVVAYYDEALTIVAAQPLRTLNGYISRAGTPAQIYIDGVNFSILVQDSKGSMVYNFPDGTGISSDACAITYTPPFTGAVAYPVCEKLEQTVSVKDFGAVGNGVADDTAEIQAAIDYMEANKCTLLFPPGTYLVSQVTIGYIAVAHPGGAEINAYGATLQGSGSSAPLKTNRNQGLAVNGLNVVKHASATYACDMQDFWYNNWTDCRLGEVRLYSTDGWGVYWNEFNNCTIESLYFDISAYSINQNIFKGGKYGAITKANAGHVTYKEAYNNVFIGVDIVGAIDWRDASASFRDPLILRDCNFEFGAATNYGFINSVGGRNSPASTSAVPYPWDDMRSEFRMNDNLIRGGACQSYSPNITTGGAATSFLSIVVDGTSPTLNGACYKMLVPGSTSSSLRISLPGEYLEEARAVGYVSFSWWEYNVVGGSTIISNDGTGDLSIPGMAITSNQWIKRFATIRLSASSTECYLQIGGSTVTDFEVRVAGVACYIGRFAYPYAPAPGEPFPRRSRVFDKTLVANGSAQNTFTLTIPASDIAGRAVIKATCFDASSVSVYQGELFYARFNTGSEIMANVVQNGKAETSFGGSATGTISAMAASATGSTVTVTTTISSFLGSPNRSVRYEVEFLDYNETLTVL